MNITIASAVVSAALGATLGWQVQDWRWSARLAGVEKSHAQALQKAEANARVKESAMRAQAERIANEDQRKQDELARRISSAERAAVGLRDEIERLNRRPTPSDPGASAFAHEAAVARELLGSCSAEYQTVARDADGLRVQLTGLQDYVATVLKITGLSQ